MVTFCTCVSESNSSSSWPQVTSTCTQRSLSNKHLQGCSDYDLPLCNKGCPGMDLLRTNHVPFEVWALPCRCAALTHGMQLRSVQIGRHVAATQHTCALSSVSMAHESPGSKMLPSNSKRGWFTSIMNMPPGSSAACALLRAFSASALVCMCCKPPSRQTARSTCLPACTNATALACAPQDAQVKAVRGQRHCGLLAPGSCFNQLRQAIKLIMGLMLAGNRKSSLREHCCEDAPVS